MRLSLMLTSTIALLAACSGGGAAPPNPLSSAGVRPAPVPNVRSADRVRAVTLYTLSNGAAHNQVVSFVPRDGRLEYDQSFDTGGLGEPSIAGRCRGPSHTATTVDFSSPSMPAATKLPASGSIVTVYSSSTKLLRAEWSQSVSPCTATCSSSSMKQAAPSRAFESLATEHYARSRSPALRSAARTWGLQRSHSILAVRSSSSLRRLLMISIRTAWLKASRPGRPYIPLGMTPFGFAFVPGNEIMVVSEAFGGTSGAGAASSYMVAPPSTLTPISMSVPDHNTAPCWVVITRNGSFAFTSNTASATISAYAIDEMGNLTLTTPNGVSAQTGQSPTDLALGPRDTYLFVLNLKSRTIGAYAIGSGGALTTVRGAHGLPPHAMGLAAVSTEF